MAHKKQAEARGMVEIPSQKTCVKGMVAKKFWQERFLLGKEAQSSTLDIMLGSVKIILFLLNAMARSISIKGKKLKQFVNIETTL